MGIVLEGKQKVTCRTQWGSLIHQLSQVTPPPPTKWRIFRDPAGGGMEMGGRILLRTLSLGTGSSHLDSNLGSGCFSSITLSKLLNHSQLLFFNYKIEIIMQNAGGPLLRSW